MSSILKALRRLEEDRARKSQVAPEIAANLLRGGALRRQSPLWVWPIVVVVVAVAVASLFWSLRPAPVAREMLTPQPPPVKSSVAAPAGQGGEVIIEEVIDQRRPVLLPPAQLPVSVPAPLPAKVTPAPPRAEAVLMPPGETRQAALPSIAERQSPVVSAIAWQEDSSARMAVIDGLPVMTGESIGAAKIQEILRDRILFVEEGILFTVRINSQ